MTDRNEPHPLFNMIGGPGSGRPADRLSPVERAVKQEVEQATAEERGQTDRWLAEHGLLCTDENCIFVSPHHHDEDEGTVFHRDFRDYA